jgi:hypothetical protein
MGNRFSHFAQRCPLKRKGQEEKMDDRTPHNRQGTIANRRRSICILSKVIGNWQGKSLITNIRKWNLSQAIAVKVFALTKSMVPNHVEGRDQDGDGPTDFIARILIISIKDRRKSSIVSDKNSPHFLAFRDDRIKEDERPGRGRICVHGWTTPDKMTGKHVLLSKTYIHTYRPPDRHAWLGSSVRLNQATKPPILAPIWPNILDWEA